jgi:hypothetical protein
VHPQRCQPSLVVLSGFCLVFSLCVAACGADCMFDKKAIKTNGSDQSKSVEVKLLKFLKKGSR